MLVPSRHGSSDSYRYGFQGQEKDDEIKGEGNSLNYTFRMHDPRIGRFFAVDPLFKEYPELTPFQFSNNSPIDMVELEGMEGGWIVEKGAAVYKAGPVINTFDNEQAARRAASMGMKTPKELKSAETSYLQFLARAPKKAKPQPQLRADDLEAQVNKFRGVNPGLAISRGVLDGFEEAPGVILPEMIFSKAAEVYQGYKVFKQSKVAANALTGGFEVINEGKRGKGLFTLAENINAIGGKENCVLVSIEFQKKLLSRVYSAAKGGSAIDSKKIMAYLYENFKEVNTFRSSNGIYNDLVSVLKEKVKSNSSIIIGKFKEAGEVTDHAFNAIKDSNGTWKFIDAQNGVQYTKAGMEKSFSSYQIFEVK